MGGRRRRGDHLQRAGAGERGCGLAAPANQPPGVAPLPHPPPPALTSCAFSSSGRCPLAFQSPRHSRNQKKNKTRKRPPPGPEEMALGPLRAPRGGGPQGPARHLPSAQPESQPRPLPAASPVTALPPAPPRPLPRTPTTGARAPPPFPQPRPQARLGLLPLQIAQRPPAPFKVHEGRVSHQTLSGRNLARPPLLADPHFQSSGQITLHSG